MNYEGCDCEEIIQSYLDRMAAEQSTYTVVQSAACDASQIETAESAKPLKTMQDFLDAPLVSEKDSAIKKLFAAGLALSKDKGVLPFEMPDDKPETIVAAVDDNLSRVKMAYQVEKGNMQPEEVADKMKDVLIARTMAVADKVVKHGLPVAVDCVCDIVSCAFPSVGVIAQVAKPVLRILSRRIVPKTQQAVRIRLDKMVANDKSVAAKAINKVVDEEIKVNNRLMNKVLG